MLDRYITTRPGSQKLYVRVPVPRHLHNRLGKREVWRSLRTTDRDLAGRRGAKIVVALQDEWDTLADGTGEPKRSPPTVAELEDIAVAAGHDSILDYEERRRQHLAENGTLDWQREARRAKINAETATQHRMTGERALVRDIVDAAIAGAGVDLAPDSPGYAKLTDLLGNALAAANRLTYQRVQGDIDAQPASALVQRVHERQAAKAKPGETIGELFEQWETEMLAKGEKRPDTINQDRKVIEQFAEFVGKDRAIDSITPIEVAEWRDTMRKLPPKWRAHNKLKNLSIRAAAVKARELELAETAFTTINKSLSTVSPLYKWLAAQPRWAGLANPCNGLFYAKVKGKNRRPSFSTDQLNKILASPLFTGFRADGKEHLPGNERADDWRYWIPLVCLFTGARIGEVAQLRIGDVRQDRGVWFVHIRHEGELTTKSGKSRPAAVHPMLKRVGFLAFVERQRAAAGGDDRAPLFPELKPNSRGQISAEPSRFWRDYLKAIGVKDGRDGFGAHSFRHTMADRLRSEAELLDDQIEVCLGHNQKTTTAGYGELSQGTVTMFSAWMNALTFDGVSFSHLYPAETSETR